MEIQFATGATQATRIFTGSALAPPAPNASNAKLSSPIFARMISSQMPPGVSLAPLSPAWAVVGAKRDPAQGYGLPHRSRKPQRSVVLGGLLVPRQEAAAHQRHGLDQHIADDGDLDDAGEHATGIGKARGAHHGAAEAVTPHRHLGDDGDDQRDR